MCMYSDLAKAHQTVLHISFNDLVIPQHTTNNAMSLTYTKLHKVNDLGVSNECDKMNEYKQTVFLVSSSFKWSSAYCF